MEIKKTFKKIRDSFVDYFQEEFVIKRSEGICWIVAVFIVYKFLYLKLETNTGNFPDFFFSIIIAGLILGIPKNEEKENGK